MAPRLSGQTSIFGVVFFVFKSLLGIDRQKKLKKFVILTRKPRSHVKILIYRTWLIPFTVGFAILYSQRWILVNLNASTVTFIKNKMMLIIILILVAIRPNNMSPVCRALSLFGFALWLMPHVSPEWGGGGVFTVIGALQADKCKRKEEVF